MSSHVFIGIDGGGTRARALIVDEHGHELARRTGGAGIVRADDPAAAAISLADLARAVLADIPSRPDSVVLCCALAGAGRETERAAVRIALALEHVATQVFVVGDAEALMTDAFDNDPGVLLVAGTGSIAWARALDGTQFRVGGWGRDLGDEGSGYAIGRAALHAIARAADGRAAATELTAAVLSQLALTGPGELVGWAARATKADVASVTPIVLRCAVGGDPAALRIRDEAVRELVLLATTAARAAALPHPRLAFAGGLIDPGAPLRDLVRMALQDAQPGCVLVDRTVDGARGATLIARHAASA